jgi:hypothetical protein
MFEHVQMDVIAKLSDVVHISHGVSVGSRYVVEDEHVAALIKYLNLLVEGNAWKLVA